ncbi:hypothetical protein D9M68_817680 [compost metagenome]
MAYIKREFAATRRFDGFCLVTSKQRFHGLATRVREEGLVVLGFGDKKPSTRIS